MEFDNLGDGLVKFAYIQDDKVALIVDADSIEQLMPLDKKYQNLMDLSSFSPVPQVGWLFENNQFRNPADNTISGYARNMKITKLGMLQRFTLQERLALLTYVQQNPVSVPAVLLQNIQVATFVDLNRVDTQTGIAYLVQLNLLTASRANEILTTPPSETEIYQG